MPHIFISYAHRDESDLREAMPHLDALVRSGQAARWSDRDLVAGGDWEAEIMRAIDAADVAVLLVTPHFLASGFIMERELPKLLEKRVVWIPVKASGYEFTDLRTIQAAHDPSRPLETLTPPERNAAWVAILKQIQATIPSVSASRSTIVGGKAVGLPRRNPLFTGREDEIALVKRAMLAGDAALTPTGVAALHGMGGEGKTQTAVEYAYRNEGEYEFIFMVRAEREGEFESQLAALAKPLNLAEASVADVGQQYHAVRRWFETHPRWLLIVDNAQRLPELREKLPHHPDGHILVTTREHVRAKFGARIEVDHLKEETGALLLLRCAGRIQRDQLLEDAPTAWQVGARQISNLLGGLALALDQAGSYIAEAGIMPDVYLEIYKERRHLPHPEPGDLDHETVTVTFSLALEQVEAIETYGPAAAQLIRICAFLSTDTIPDEIFALGHSALDDPLRTFAKDKAQWLEVVRAATRYSLIARDADFGGFTLHRLVADVIRDAMDEGEQYGLTERAVNVLNAVFPDPDYETWPLCGRLLTHSLTLSEAIPKIDLVTLQASRLLSKSAMYLQQRARYSEAETLYLEELRIARRLNEGDAQSIVASLSNRGLLLNLMGRYTDAAAVLEEAVGIVKRLPEEETNTARHWARLADVFYSQRRYDKAEPLWRRALDLTQAQLGPEDVEVSVRLGHLAMVLGAMGKFEEAEPLHRRSLSIKLRHYPEGHPEIATSLLNLGIMYVRNGNFKDAEAPLRQSLKIRDQFFQEGHPVCATSRVWVARCHYARGDLATEVGLLQEALSIRERFLSLRHPSTMDTEEELNKIQRELDDSSLR